MATRKNNNFRKSSKNFRKTRSKRQRGGTSPELGEQLLQASKNGETNVVKQLLEKNSSLNVDDIKDIDGWTSLIWASENGHTDIVQLLLNNGAKATAATTSSNSALHFASNQGHTDIVKLLLGNGAMVNATTITGNTALIWASEKGQYNTVKLLLDNGADVNTKTNEGTALIWASQKGHTDIVKLLLDNGAKVNATTTTGITALHLASANNHYDTVTTLLNNKPPPNVDAKTISGKTAVFFAAAKGNTPVLEVLLEVNGANPNLRPNIGPSPHTAANNNRDLPEDTREVAKMLIENAIISRENKDNAMKEIEQFNRKKVPSLAEMARNQITSEEISKLRELYPLPPTKRRGGRRKKTQKKNKRKNKKSKRKTRK
jgi:ankyrin repeat protein